MKKYCIISVFMLLLVAISTQNSFAAKAIKKSFDLSMYDLTITHTISLTDENGDGVYDHCDNEYYINGHLYSHNGFNFKSAPVKNKDGKIITPEEQSQEIAQRPSFIDGIEYDHNSSLTTFSLPDSSYIFIEDSATFKPIAILHIDFTGSVVSTDTTAIDSTTQGKFIYTYNCVITEQEGVMQESPSETSYIDIDTLLSNDPAYNKEVFEETYDNTKALSLYPNPANNILNVQIGSDLSSILTKFAIYNINGVVIKTLDMNKQTSVAVDISKLPNGSYTLDAVNTLGIKISRSFIISK